MSFGEFNVATVSKISYLIWAHRNALNYVGSTFQGYNIATNSFDVLYNVTAADAVGGWVNWLNPNSGALYSSVKFVGNAAKNHDCGFNEIELFGKSFLKTSVSDLTELACPVYVKVNGNEYVQIDSKVTYRQDSTPTVTSLSPNLGTTAGGTVVTLVGTSFGTLTADVSVMIDGVACVVSTV